ncbi:MAG: class I SAM-dependent methyltransferase, partial [bacterium]|nr:class I SAM-dependent methyltransferase [bacterium]
MNDHSQEQTKDAFAFKWGRRDSYEGEAVKTKNYKWLVERYFGKEEGRHTFLREADNKRLLDAGCGSGFTASLLFNKSLNKMRYLGVDISEAVDDGRQRFKELGLDGQFIQDDIATMKLGEEFDIIYSDGVLHHTSRPFETFKNLVSHLAEGGVVMFYVYREKAPVREFTDDLIRERIKHLTNEAAWEQLIPLTKLGKTLGDLNLSIDIDEDIDLLDIPKGKHNLQRLFYYYFFKAYYDENFSLEEMN